MSKNIRKRINLEKGLTLVETLVAITILLISIAAPMTIAQKGISSAQLVRNQITASFLAQDALEYLKNERDNNIINGINWRNGFANCVGNSCTVDSPNDSIDSCGASCEPLRRDASSGLYGHDASWAETIFTREVDVSYLGTDEMEITVTVSWNQHGSTKQILLRENILNWDEN